MIRDHSKRVCVALFRWAAVLQTETGGVQQFWCHISDSADERGRRTARIHGVRIRYDSDESIVSEPRVEITVDEDVCLGNCERRSGEMVSGAYRLEVTVYDIHRVQILQSAGPFCELRRIQGLGRGGRNNRTHETKAVDFGML